jgi:hypothetical protein
MLRGVAHFAESSFDAETTRAMGVAFEMACKSLGLSDTADPLTKLVALKIIDSASEGEQDAVRLHEAVMLWAATA